MPFGYDPITPIYKEGLFCYNFKSTTLNSWGMKSEIIPISLTHTFKTYITDYVIIVATFRFLFALYPLWIPTNLLLSPDM